VQKHSRHIDDPILPVVTDDDGDPLDVPLMMRLACAWKAA
jgi:hypothetical protein